MSITGKSSLSIKKQDLQGQKAGSTGFRKITFAHKATAGETGISLSNLTTPSELLSTGFTQPSPALLAAANLKFFRNNLTLISSARGVLQDYLSYTVNNSTYISFSDSFGPALDGEIFVGVIDSVPRNDLVGLDATSILASGELAAGVTQFNVGKAFKVNANPTTQIGEFAVYLDGVIQFRNAGNAAADPSADGNYHEIDNGSGYGTLIEFNDVDNVNARSVMIVGTGVSIIRPNGSLVQELESLAGQIDAMIPTLAALAGVPESTFQAAPNNVDLKAFGDRIIGLEGDQGAGNPRLATSSQSGAIESYEENTFTPYIFAAGTDFTSVTYNIQSGVFTKFGRMVFYRLDVRWTATSGVPVGQLRIGGLPHAPAAVYNTSVYTESIDFNAGALYCMAGTVTGQQYLGLVTIHDNAASQSVDSALNTGGTRRIQISGFYHI